MASGGAAAAAPALLATAGFMAFVHACYVTIQHRHHLKIDDEAFVAAPAVVWIECAVAAALCLTGGWAMAGTLKPVRSSLAESANDSLNVRPEFAAMYRGRAHALR